MKATRRRFTAAYKLSVIEKADACETPGEIVEWFWDITRLLGPEKWQYFYLYVILDIFSRYVTGWMVAERETAGLAGGVHGGRVRVGDGAGQRDGEVGGVGGQAVGSGDRAGGAGGGGAGAVRAGAAGVGGFGAVATGGGAAGGRRGHAGGGDAGEVRDGGGRRHGASEGEVVVAVAAVELRAAADRWMEVVVSDLPDIPIDGHLDYCADNPGPRLVGSIDDVVIRVRLNPRSQRNVVGSAAACGRREGSELTFYGTIKLSPYYLDRDPPTYTWYGTGLHEIGHVLGIGGIPRWHELLREPSSNSNPGAADRVVNKLPAAHRTYRRRGTSLPRAAFRFGGLPA